MATPLTFYGGKQSLADQIVARMPAHRVYLEAFCGGAAVLFAKPRAEREVINDLDGRVVRFWRALRDHPEELAQAVALTPYAREEWEFCRDKPDAEDDVEAARRFLCLTDQSFSRSWGSWAPPSIALDKRGRWQPGTWSSLPRRIRDAAQRLAGVCVERTDGVELAKRFDLPEAVIYIDPPYTGKHRLTPEKGYAYDDSDGLWKRLCNALLEITHAQVLLSGYPCEETLMLEDAGWECVRLAQRRRVARADGRLGWAPERLWCSPRAQVGQMRLAGDVTDESGTYGIRP